MAKRFYILKVLGLFPLLVPLTGCDETAPIVSTQLSLENGVAHSNMAQFKLSSWGTHALVITLPGEHKDWDIAKYAKTDFTYAVANASGEVEIEGDLKKTIGPWFRGDGTTSFTYRFFEAPSEVSLFRKLELKYRIEVDQHFISRYGNSAKVEIWKISDLKD